MSQKQDPKGGGALSRRTFIKGTTTVVSSLAVAQTLPGCANEGGATAQASGEAKALRPAVNEMDIVLTVNGEDYSLSIEPRVTLAEALRDVIGLTGTKIGCDRAACGACTIQMDGKSILSCSMLAVEAEGRDLTTIEGLALAGELTPLQQNFVKNDALQCGFCTAGMVMSCKALLEKNPTPDVQDIKNGVAGNICRCGTYPRVFQAVLDTARDR